MWVRGIAWNSPSGVAGPDTPFAYTFASSGPLTRLDSTHCYYIWDGFSGISLVPINVAFLPGSIDLFMVGGGGSGQDTGTGAMGGGAGGEAKYVYGHPAPAVATMAIRGGGGGVLNPKGGDTTFDVLSARGGDRGGTPGSGIGAGNGVYIGGNPVGGTAGGGGAGSGGPGDNAVSATIAGDGGGWVVNNWRTGSNDLYGRGGGGGGQGGGVTFGIGGEMRGAGGRARNGVSQPPISGSNGILIIRHLRLI